MSSSLELLHVHRRTGRGTSPTRADGAGARYLLLVVGVSLVLLALGLALHGPVGG